MAKISAVATSSSKVKVTVSGLDTSFAYTRRFEWFVDGELYGTSTGKAGVSSVSKTIRGLEPSTTYTFSVDIYRDDNDVYITTLEDSATTDSEEDTGSFSIGTTTDSSVKISISYPNGADYCRVFIYEGNTSIGTSDYLYLKSSYTYSGLSPSTSYRANVYFYTSNSASTVYYQCSAQTFTTDELSNFNWTYAGYKNGTLVKGSQKISGYGFYVSASEWNELIDTTILKLKSKGKYSSSSYPMTTASNGSKFTAVMFNQVRFAIGSMVSTGIADKSKGDPILADDLNTLMDCLNQV